MSSAGYFIVASPKKDFSGFNRVPLPKIEVTSAASFCSLIVSAANLAIGGFKKLSAFSFEFAAVL